MKTLKTSDTIRTQATDELLSSFSLQKSLDEMNDNPRIVATLIKKGADVNVCTEDKKTLLMIAISRESNAEILRLLLEAGANPNTKDKDGKTALMHATEQENFETMELLLKYGADVGIKDRQGNVVKDYALDIVFWHQRPYFDLIAKYEKMQLRIKKKRKAEKKIQEKALLRKDVVTEIIAGLEKDLGE